jgi:hypothetical protein
MHFACGVVVGIEKKVIPVVVSAVIVQEGLKHEMFKKPCCVGQVPLGGTHIRHALNHEVFGFETPAQI